ncbi:MAG TPA: ATP-binding protein, partial [Gemmatimonadales bacterium]|nr:ATP-binding protein [Gemmatimonadales bacterium]
MAIVLLWTYQIDDRLRWTLAILMGLFLVGGAAAVRERVIRPVQTLSNLVGALGEGDFSIRARGANPDDDLGLAYYEVNALAEALRQQRLGSIEAGALLRRVIAEIDAAIFAFDGEWRLRLVNRAGATLLDAPVEKLLGRDASTLALAEYLDGEAPRIVEASFPGKSGRWEVRRGTFRQGGRPHLLLVLNDVGAVLREQERQAWQQVIRVLSHEVNNSLAPIKSIAESLTQGTAAGASEDLRSGLAVIASRSESLRRFMSSYAKLARLPQPTLTPLDVGQLVNRAARLETRVPITVTTGPAARIHGDADQLEQVLINVLQNAADASAETGGGVRVTWHRARGGVGIVVEDDGPGLADTANLFVPFFTTKPEGSGIGLVLSRQIIEA